jgi:hypothetical protein
MFDASGLQHLSVGGVDDGFSSTVTLAMSWHSAFLVISLRVTATSLVRAKHSSLPSSTSSLLNLISWVGSQDHRCSKYSLPENYCQVGV